MNMNCQGCGKVYIIDRSPEIPRFIKNMKCNWCPDCEKENANELWKEWYAREPKNKQVQEEDKQLTFEQGK